MRKSEGTIVKRGAQQYRARITLREKEYSKTFTSAGDAETWLLKLRLSADEDDRAHQLYVQKLSLRVRSRLWRCRYCCFLGPRPLLLVAASLTSYKQVL